DTKCNPFSSLIGRASRGGVNDFDPSVFRQEKNSLPDVLICRPPAAEGENTMKPSPIAIGYVATVISAIFLLIIPSLALADTSANLTLGDLMNQGAVQQSRDDLLSLLPGAKVSNVSRNGSVRHWENIEGREFVASATNPTAGLNYARFTGKGSWRLGDNGTYCVHIEWPVTSEQWCHFIFKLGSKYYTVRSTTDPASPAYEFTFVH
ncbi:MAG: hypothetical protein AB7E15_15695, partial [Azospira sp.]